MSLWITIMALYLIGCLVGLYSYNLDDLEIFLVQVRLRTLIICLPLEGNCVYKT